MPMYGFTLVNDDDLILEECISKTIQIASSSTLYTFELYRCLLPLSICSYSSKIRFAGRHDDDLILEECTVPGRDPVTLPGCVYGLMAVSRRVLSNICAQIKEIESPLYT